MTSERNDKIKISIVMPVYNAEEYLPKSLKDIMRQSLREIELICVDDGSTDRSAEMLRRFAKRDQRIRLLTQEHQSAGAARNRGFREAVGKYVIFWDVDDRFSRDALKCLYEKAEEKQSDICVCGAHRFAENDGLWETTAYLRREMLPDVDPFCKSDMTESIFCFASNVPWNKLYRREFIVENDLKYEDRQQANDTYFTIMALYRAKRITYVDRALIYYQVNNANSITGNSFQTRLCIYEAYRNVWADLEKKPDFLQLKRGLQNKILDNFYYALNIQTKFEAYRELYLKIQQEGLREFELDTLTADDVQQKWQYTDLQRLKELPPEEFLLRKAYDRRMDNDRIRQNANKLRDLLHKERTAGISYKLWRTFHALYRHTIGKKLT